VNEAHLVPIRSNARLGRLVGGNRARSTLLALQLLQLLRREEDPTEKLLELPIHLLDLPDVTVYLTEITLIATTGACAR